MTLHADTLLPSHWDSMLLQVHQDPTTVLSYFSFGVDLSSAEAQKTSGMRNMIFSVNQRCRFLWLPFGDQVEYEESKKKKRLPNTKSLL